MATKFVPDIEIIRKRATQEEKAFLEIIKDLGDEYEVFYQPPTELAHVDFAILKRGAGLFIVEVYSGTLEGIEVKTDPKNHEYYVIEGTETKLLSPFQAVLSYKDEFYNLLSEELFNLSLKEESSKAYGLVQTAVYFPNTTLNKLTDLYNGNARLDRRKYGKSANARYTWAFVENTDDWIRAIIERSLKSNELFDNSVFQSVRDALSGDWQQHIIRKEGKALKKYQYAAERKLHAKGSMRDKIRGVAGSGKTMYAVQRAIIRYRNTGKPVLILCYNLTLVNYLQDEITRYSPDLTDYERLAYIRVADYDSFMPQMMESNGFDPLYYASLWNEPDENEQYDQTKNEERWKELHKAQIKVFDDNAETMQYSKYDTVIIDEYQDFHPDWLRAIYQHFAAKGGEIFVLADEKQKIYDNARISNRELETPGIENDWLFLSEPHRMTNELMEAAIAFQRPTPLKELYNLDDVDFVEKDFIHEASILEYCYAGYCTADEFYSMMTSFAERAGVQLSEVAVLSGNADVLQELEDHLSAVRNDLKVMATFESGEQKRKLEQRYGARSAICKAKRKAAARIRKHSFHVESDALKLSTINSFKGLETKAVVYLLNRSESNYERVYTAITRAKAHLLVINMGNDKFDGFFRNPVNGFKWVALPELTPWN